MQSRTSDTKSLTAARPVSGIQYRRVFPLAQGKVTQGHKMGRGPGVGGLRNPTEGSRAFAGCMGHSVIVSTRAASRDRVEDAAYETRDDDRACVVLST
jgi:hypothetical protein